VPAGILLVLAGIGIFVTLQPEREPVDVALQRDVPVLGFTSSWPSSSKKRISHPLPLADFRPQWRRDPPALKPVARSSHEPKPVGSVRPTGQSVRGGHHWQQGKDIVLGIRPEDIYNADGPYLPSAVSVIPARVDVVEPIGNEV
jgi:hypothetical protein